MKYLLPLLILLLSACSEDDSPNSQTPDMEVDAPSDAFSDMGQDAEDLDDAGVDAEPDLIEVERTIFERGNHQVGFTKYTVTYDAVGEEGRTFSLKVWYPTLDKEGRSSRYAGLFNRPEVFLDAAPYVPGPAPVLVFSHGNSSFAEQSYFMTEYFASHGWMVVAPDHTGNTFRDTQGGISFESGAFRPQDITATLDFIYNLPQDDLFSGAFSDDVVLTGHSFGGYTTLASAGASFDVDNAVEFCAEPGAPSACQILSTPEIVEKLRDGFLDERVNVAIPQTPGGYLLYQEGIGDIEIPTLLMTAARDATLPDAAEGAPIWAALGPRSMRLDMLNAGHFSYSNMCVVLGFVPEVQNDGCDSSFIEPELGFQIMNAYAMAFARLHLFNDAENLDLLNGTDNRWSEHIDLDFKAEALAP